MHIITRLDMGGSSQNTLLTCLGMAEKYDLILVHGLSLESQMTALEKERVEVQVDKIKEKEGRIIPLRPLVRQIDPLQDLHALMVLWRLICFENPEIVHTHSSKAGILGRLAAKMAGVPHIIHTPHGHVFFGHFSVPASKLFLWIEKIFDKITDRQIALTEGEKNDYLKFSVSKERKLVTIHSGVDTDQFAVASGNGGAAGKKALGLNPSELVIGTVGWLLPIKGPECLLMAMIRVWNERPDARLVFVGKGELEGKLKDAAVQAKVSDKILFLGWREDIPQIMAAFDIFVLPSLNEGMGRVLVEAMAAGKPVIASSVGGIPDLVKNGENGFLVEPADPLALAEAVKLLIGSPELRMKMGAAGREMSEKYSVAAMIEKLDKLYEQVIRGEKRGVKS